MPWEGDPARPVGEGDSHVLANPAARSPAVSHLTYRELADRAGWSHGIVGEYLSGKILPPTDRFDVLAALLGADAVERGQLATARDRVDDGRRMLTQAGAALRQSPVPRQLPPDLPSFAGRAAALAGLDAALAQRTRQRAVVIALVWGGAGVGKSALAAHWARRATSHFPDGQLHTTLRPHGSTGPGSAGLDSAGLDSAGPDSTGPDSAGPDSTGPDFVGPGSAGPDSTGPDFVGPGSAGPDRAVAEALRGMLETLGVPPAGMPESLDQRSSLFRSMLSGRRTLLVLDGAGTADQVRRMLPGTPGNLVLVTSRNALAGLVAIEGARPVALGPMPAGESRLLLARRLGEDRMTAEPAAVDRIVDACGGLPLALAAAAAFAATRPTFPLAALADELAAHGWAALLPEPGEAAARPDLPATGQGSHVAERWAR